VARDTRGFFEAIIGDGRALISFTGLCLLLSGAFAILQSASGQFLPHDTAFLRITREQLCSINECRIVHFMFHDRVSFGGSLIAIAALYLWLAEFPLRAGEPWAWRTLAASGFLGFGSFLTYLGYGYLDTWHGVATLLLLPCFLGGLWLQRGLVREAPTEGDTNRGAPWRSRLAGRWASLEGVGLACLLAATASMIVAGITIQIIGMTCVFVPTDLTFMGLSRAHLDAISPRLVPLIAHDRAGFGGGVATAGLLAMCCVWWGTPSKSLWQALFVGGIAGWGCAIGIHPLIGYNNAIHVGPAVAAAGLYFLGLALLRPAMYQAEPVDIGA
jgi:hypothetical protein